MATIKRNGDKVVLKDGKVSCGCCGCPCESVLISGELLSVLTDISTRLPPYNGDGLICNSEAPIFFQLVDITGGFIVRWELFNPIDIYVSFDARTNCLQIIASNFINNLYAGELDGCCPVGPECSIASDILINGKDFPAWNFVGLDGYPLVDPLAFTFS